MLWPTGKHQLMGGDNERDTAEATADLYDPASGTFTLSGSMAVPREFFTASSLTNGQVLVAGGVSSFSASILASAEVYDPASGAFSPTGSLASGRAQQVGATLNDGRVLLTQGAGGATAEIYYSTAPLAPIAITTTGLAGAATGKPYTQILLEQGGVGTLTWTETGSLPAGMSLRNKGVLSETQTVAGSFPLTITVTDSSNPAKSASSNFTLTVANSPLVFTASTVPTAVVGRPYIQALPIAGGTQPYNATVTSGALPPGLGLSSNGVLNGTASVTR